ncbi:MAG: glycoside hydrolase family 25 protein [Eggerthellaceae bacterium]|nr:glycoside hydrolase family 25 protein [Eggerthellaceae bacterium]MDR2716396.1 glycoside hydrolase family 25 protein [Coriobacteriaceae bacterium]
MDRVHLSLRQWGLLAAVLLLAVLLLLGTCTLRANAQKQDEPGQGGVSTTLQEPAFRATSDWPRLSYKDGRFFYQREEALASRTGIDVSSYQGAIDWESVAADGIDFAMIRVGNRGFSQGDLYLDEFFEENIKGAREEGILVGAYFFSQAINEQEAIAEADFVIESLAGAALDYPVAFDHEPINDPQARANNLSKKQLGKNAKAFCDRIEAAGYIPMIYGNKRDLSRFEDDFLEAYDIWLAEYDISAPDAPFSFAVWQYSNSGFVDGIYGDVDLNVHLLPTQKTS